MACPTAQKHTCWDCGLGLPQPDCPWDLMTVSSEPSRFPLMERMHMPQVSDSGELNKNSHIALIHVAFPLAGQGRHSRTVISELNTAPMHTLTNASPRHHWSSTHSSGSEWIATPFSVEDLPSTSVIRRLTSYSMPVLTGAFPASRFPQLVYFLTSVSHNTCREFGIEKTNELNKAAIKSIAAFEIDRMQRILGIVQEWCQDWFGMRHRVSKIVR